MAGAVGGAGLPGAAAGANNGTSGSGATVSGGGGSAGTPVQTTAGATSAGSSSGGAPPITPAGGKGNGDDGNLFPPGSAVPYMAAGGTTGAPGGGGAGGLNIDGTTVTSQIGGSVSGSAKFTQMGIDVSVVVKLTKCPSGTLGLHINSGDSCDNMDTEGKPWSGKRGNIGDTGSIVCANNSANLTYTRKGTDPATKWTVGDHNLMTDITNYVVIVSQNADGSGSYLGCGNFFK